MGFNIVCGDKNSDSNMNVQVGERATGYGVSLLNSLFGTASKAALLQVNTIANGQCLLLMPIFYDIAHTLNYPFQQATSPGRDNGALDVEDRGPSQGQTKKARIE